MFASLTDMSYGMPDDSKCRYYRDHGRQDSSDYQKCLTLISVLQALVYLAIIFAVIVGSVLP